MRTWPAADARARLALPSGVYGGLGLGTVIVRFAFVPSLESREVALTPPGLPLVLAGALVLGAVALVGLRRAPLRLCRLDVVSTPSADWDAAPSETALAEAAFSSPSGLKRGVHLHVTFL